MERCVWGQRLLLPCVVCPPPGSAAPSPQGKSRPFLLYPSGGAAPDTGEGARETHRATPPRPRPGHACVHTYTHSRRGCPRPEGGGGGWVVKPPAAVRAARGRDASEGLRPTEGRRRRVRGVGGPGKSRFPPSLVAGGWTGGMRREGCGERSSGAPPAPSPSAFPGRSRPPLSALPAREARPAAASPAPPAPLPGAGAAAPVRSHRMWREAVRCWRLGEAERDGP